MPASPTPPQSSAPAGAAEAVIFSWDELRSILAAVEIAYEGAWHYADIGRVPFGPFEGLPKVIRILRRHRDGIAS